MSDLRQCPKCEHGGWTVYELKDGKCPSCREYDEMLDECYCISCGAMFELECCCDENE